MFPSLETFEKMSTNSIDKVSTFCNIEHMETTIESNYDQTAKLFKVLGHPMRLAIVQELGERSWCVCELAAHLGLNKSAASKHLSQLKQIGVIEMQRDGTQVLCTLKMPCVFDMMRCALTPKTESQSLASCTTDCCSKET
jgi:ArsR family transcriptional regulator